MSTLKLIGFTGEIPKSQPRLLPDMAAQIAQNVRLTNGGLVPTRRSRFEATAEGVADAIKTIYRHQGEWLSWDTVVNAAPGPVADDRLYYTGDGVPKMRIGADVYPLAVPFPAGGLTATPSVSSTTRVYGYTNMDASDVESTLSPTLSVTYDSNLRIKLKGFVVPSGIVKQRIYRQEGGIWYFVYQRTAATTNYTDIEDTVTAQDPPSSSAVAAPVAALTYETVDKDKLTRLYVYTFVTSFGEESAPSLPSNLVEWQDGMTVTLSGFEAAPAGRAITKQRIYRSQTSSSGGNMFLIAERDASTSDFIDNIKIDDFAEPLPSTDWNPPPDDLQGLVEMPNGMMAGFSGKEICFCEPYHPHAWPIKYRLTVAYQPMALGAFGTTLAVMTDGVPYVMSGTAPENMVQEKIELNLPCINARGVVDLGYAIAYPSHDGLVSIGSNGPKVITAGLMSREDWLATGPATFVAGQYNAKYFASYSYLDSSGVELNGTFIIDMTGTEMFLTRTSSRASSCFYDLKESALYMLQGNSIVQYDALGKPNEVMTWRSKLFVLPTPTNFGVIKIESGDKTSSAEQDAIDEMNAEIQAENEILFALPSIGGELNGGALNVYPVNGDMLGHPEPAGFISVSIYADKKLVAVVSKMDRECRLPAGFEAHLWEIQVNGTREVSQITLARTGKELREVA